MPASPKQTAEVLIAYDEPIQAEDGSMWRARVLGKPNDLGHWEGWIEFAPATAPVSASSASDSWTPTERETTQPNRTDLKYWATGLTVVYLQGALGRALNRGRPRPAPSAPTIVPSRGPAPHLAGAPAGVAQHAVLDPFAVYAQGEKVLRSELHALSPDHLRAIASAYALDVRDGDGDLADRIVADVKRQSEGRRE